MNLFEVVGASLAAQMLSAAPDPEIARIVGKMQAFYERTQDFEAHFDQTYLYKTFNRKQQSEGVVKFAKPGLMRWDYQAPNQKVFVVAKDKAYVFDPEARTMYVSPLSNERLSTSITFLWGRGHLADEFEIQKSSRPDLAGGIQLELTPKKADPRFQKIYFLLDAKTCSVRSTLVIDPDGSENRMDFSAVKVNPGLKSSDLDLKPPADTQIIKH